MGREVESRQGIYICRRWYFKKERKNTSSLTVLGDWGREIESRQGTYRVVFNKRKNITLLKVYIYTIIYDSCKPGVDVTITILCDF
jgi:hypothetical protein